MNKTIILLSLLLSFITPLFGANHPEKVLLFYNMEADTTFIYKTLSENFVDFDTLEGKRHVHWTAKGRKYIEISYKDRSGNINLLYSDIIDESINNGIRNTYHGCPATIYQTISKFGEIVRKDDNYGIINFFIEFPDKPIGIGHNWSKEYTDPFNSEIKIKNSYIFAGFVKYQDKQCVKILFDSYSDNSFNNNKTITYHIEAMGKIYFDYKNGVILYSDILIFNSMKMKNETNDELYSESRTKSISYLSEIKNEARISHYDKYYSGQ